jgi:phosphomannomutase
MGKIYKAYDIRGIYPDEINEDTAYKIGRAYADFIKKDSGKSNITLCVGRDMRTSSPILCQKAIQGVIEQGANVIDIGLVSTPTFYYGVSTLGADGGIQISASHNPKEYNGVKLVKHKAIPVGYDDGIKEIEEKVANVDFCEPSGKAAISYNNEALRNEVDFALKKCSPEKIKPLKVVADAANAMGAPYIADLFKHLPCELIEMNFELDGTFPVHEADPFKEENVKDLCDKVLELKADIGIATDGDGDRIFFVDEKGHPVEPSILRGLLAEIVLKEHPNSTVCYDIRPGRITRDIIEKNGGRAVVTRVGHSLIKKVALKENAIFAGESSGHFFFNTEVGLFEMPMIVILKLLEKISMADKKFSEIVEPLKKYFHSGEINSVVDDKDKKMKEIAEKYKDAKISRLDGVSIECEDFWFNVRASNTESLLRLNVEAVSEQVMIEKRDELLKMIRG